VECALKACIAKQTQRHDFPDPEFVKGLFVHKPKDLLPKGKLTQARAMEGEAIRSFARTGRL
jgi:hypothetical protein